jgi:pimeloyl-ACP methyl ester carboxylesterase
MLASAVAAAAGPANANAALALRPCRLDGLAQAALCGALRRPLDPARPQGTQIDIQVAVLPALARRKAADPVLFFAGGPGQSAIELAGPLSAAYGRLAQRRDLVFIDQRGTGRSAPLRCADDAPAAVLRPLAEQADAAQRLARLQACRRALQALPHGDLRFYTTAIASADVDAVRAALGVGRFNAIGASYGTRAVLDYARQFPQHLRRVVLDGVVPPDMRLTETVSADNQAALDGVFDACAAEPACARRHPALRAQWQQLLASLPRTVSLPHPVSGQLQALVLDRDGLLGLVRGPLYAPALAAALPAAVAEAAAGRFAALAALGQALGGAPGGRGAVAMGMHLSVVCSEDLAPAAAAPAPVRAAPPAANDFGDSFARFYAQACADWPRGRPPAGFEQLPPAGAPTWLLSGGADPVTPPRHAQRVAQALGALARHTVVAQAGHGVANLPCLRDAVQRFVSADDDAQALQLATDTGCAADLPRPPAFVVPGQVAHVWPKPSPEPPR